MYPSISWGTWFFISIPVCILSILLIWALLLATFHPGRGTIIVPIRPVKDRFSGVQWFITIVTVATIILWCVSHQLEHIFGDMGVIAIIPLVLFFGTGILTKEDFNNFLWTIIILAAGGLCLGKSVTSSGLLHNIAGAITDKVDGLSLYGVLLVFASLILVIATFISHTVAALIILPLVQQVGVGMNDPHPNLLVMASALMCSVAMGLPTSGFPNMSKSPFQSDFVHFHLLCGVSANPSTLSCYYDGSSPNRPTLPPRPTLPHSRYPSQSALFRCGGYSRIRPHGRGGPIETVSVPKVSCRVFLSCFRSNDDLECLAWILRIRYIPTPFSILFVSDWVL